MQCTWKACTCVSTPSSQFFFFQSSEQNCVCPPHSLLSLKTGVQKVVLPSLKHVQDFPQIPLVNVAQKGILRAHIYPFDKYLQLSSCKHVSEFSI